MKTTIASEKEKILEELKKKFSKRITERFYQVANPQLIDFFSDSLEHISSVAKYEGREEAFEFIRDAIIQGDKFSRDIMLRELAKLTGKEKGEV